MTIRQACGFEPMQLAIRLSDDGKPVKTERPEIADAVCPAHNSLHDVQSEEFRMMVLRLKYDPEALWRDYKAAAEQNIWSREQLRREKEDLWALIDRMPPGAVCHFFVATDPAYSGNHPSPPGIAFCATHQRPASICQSATRTQD